MFSLFGPKSEPAIVFHIGSASVCAGLLQLEAGKAPKILHFLREPIPYRDSVAADRFTADMLEALKKANLRVAKEGPKGFAPKHVYYVFSSPWTATQTKVISIKEEKPFTLTRRHVDRVVASQTKAAPGLQLFEKRVTDIRLNGYQVEDPYGKKAKTADIALFMSFIPKTLLDSVMEASARTFHPRDTKISSFTLAGFLAIRDSFRDEGDFIFLDVGGELSDVAIVKDGLMLETASFPLGRHFMIRALQRDLQVSAEEALSLLRVYEEGVADESLAKGLQPVVDKAAIEWMTGFRSALAKTGKGMALPTKVFLATSSDFVRFFTRIVGSETASLPGTADIPMSATPLDGGSAGDPFIAISASLAAKLYESPMR